MATVTVLTYNVAKIIDSMRLMQYDHENIPDERIKNIIKKIKPNEFLDQKDYLTFYKYAKDNYKKLLRKEFEDILSSNNKPDVICLQEFNPEQDHDELCQQITSDGYTLCGIRDVSIAWSSRFQLLQHGQSTAERPAYFVDLR